MVGEKVLLRRTAFNEKHKIQDHWEHTIYEVFEQPLGKIPVFKIQSMEGDDKVKIVHRNLLLVNRIVKSLVDPKETISTQEVIAVGAIASHVHNLGACEGAQVTNMFQRGLDYVTALFWEHWDLLGPARLDL